MRLRLIRNATMLWTYNGRRILTDPYLADRFAAPSYSGRSRNPVVELPLAIDDLSIKTSMATSKLAMNLLNMEMQGYIRSLPGKTYALI